MSEKLKFTITYGETLNLGNYESKKLTLSQEFYLDESNKNFEVDKIRAWVKAVIREP